MSSVVQKSTAAESPLVLLCRKWNNFPSSVAQSRCLPVFFGEHHIGYVRPEHAKVMSENYPKAFREEPDSTRGSTTFSVLSEESLATALERMRTETEIQAVKGWRNELYAIRSQFHLPTLLLIERSAACLFGMRQYGTTLIGIVHHPQKGKCVWLQRRAKDKPTWPGQWDVTVSGGLSAFLDIRQRMIQEAEEEAGIPEVLLKDMKAAGIVSFFHDCPRGMYPSTEFMFEVELPSSFTPKNMDGEVDEFRLVSLQELYEAILDPSFKITACPMAVDCLIRHGYLDIETEPQLIEILESIHVPLDSFYRMKP
ncbi:unnamed protein product [Cyprideis torosa]|uniref:Uncharacterized protein n=1 Tax=Cyprideis torosa TaxID=163714 RepID=A0A7R8WBY4_9CRUS|nr:unnamed protein product [Cyprideis torosa]CAG0892786.1 unnamed protein product [Cyprideis torosa]